MDLIQQRQSALPFSWKNAEKSYRLAVRFYDTVSSRGIPVVAQATEMN